MRRCILIALAALCGCGTEAGPRVVHVRVSADEPFRTRQNWKGIIASRVEAANKTFAPLGVRWDVSLISEWAVDVSVPLEMQRHRLGGHIGTDSIAVGIVTGPRGNALGAESPFDPRLLVVDMPSQPEAYNEAVLTHQLGHVLGAWDSSDTASFMHVPPGTGPDARAATVVHITRGVNFLKGADGLSPDATATLDKLWIDSKPHAAPHPLATYWGHLGEELISKSNLGLAIEPLSSAVKYQPDDPKLRLSLALALGATQNFAAAAREFRRAAELDPNSALAFSALGETLANLQKWDEAVAALRKALELSPNESQAHASLGMVLIHMPAGRQEGVAELKTALKLNPDNAAAASALKLAQQQAGTFEDSDGKADSAKAGSNKKKKGKGQP